MFYTYLWLREDGTQYYVGKGKGNRARQDLGHTVRRPPKERIVVFPATSEVDAFETEIALIWYYGRKDLGEGCLRNLTDGGDGASGYKRYLENMSGLPFGKLTVMRRAGSDHSGNSMWLCKCTCGNTCTVRGTSLRSGHTLCCGCFSVGKNKSKLPDHKVRVSFDAEKQQWRARNKSREHLGYFATKEGAENANVLSIKTKKPNA